MNELLQIMQSFCEKLLQQKQAANIDQSTLHEMSIQDMEDLKQHYLDEMLSLSNDLQNKDYHNEKVDIHFRRECEDMIDELKGKFNGMSIEINKKIELQQLEQNEIISQIPLSNAIAHVSSTIEDLEDSLIMGNEDLSNILEKKSDEFIKFSVKDLVPIPSEFEDTSRSDSQCILPLCDDFSPINVSEGKPMTFSNPLSDQDVSEDNVKIYSNPLFEFDDEYISSDVNPLFDKVLKDIECKVSYDSNLDELTLLVTPLFDSNEDECFALGDNNEFLLHCDPSTPKMSEFTDEQPLEENDDLFDLESKKNDWKKIFYDASIDDLMIEEKNFNPGGDIDEIVAFLAIDISTNNDGFYDSKGDVLCLKSLHDNTTHNPPPEADGSKPSSDDGKKVDEDPRKENECNDQEKEDNVNSTNNVNTVGNVNIVSSTINTAGINRVNDVGKNISIELQFDLNMPALEDVSTFDFLSEDEDDGAVADMNIWIQQSKKPTRKYTQVSQASGPTESVADEAVHMELDEAVHMELGNSLVRAATIASSLEAEQGSGNISKTQSKVTPNKPSSQGTGSGGGPKCQETIGDTIAQTTDEDSLKLDELMALCTTLQNMALDLEKTTISQHNEIDSLKKRVKKLEKKNRSRTHRLKRLYNVGLTTKVEYSSNEESLGKDASIQGRTIDAIDADEESTLVSVHDANKEMFDLHVLGGKEVFVAGKNENVVEEVVDAAQVSTDATTVTITTKEITLAQALEALKTLKPKLKWIIFQELEEPMKPKKKDQIRLDEEASKKLQAEFDEKERLAKEKVEKEEKAHIALIET
nr:hypothetical protein [Tanacetum cinerariifolium]